MTTKQSSAQGELSEKGTSTPSLPINVALTPPEVFARYPGGMVIPLQQPGTPGAPFFDGRNVTEFLRAYDRMCDDSGLSETSRAGRVDVYCDRDRGAYLRTLPEYHAEEWEELKKVLRKEFKSLDIYQQQRTMRYLEDLKNSKIEDIRQYCRMYKTTADHLLKTQQISEYACALWFMQGLPKHIVSRHMDREKVDPEKPETMDFRKLYEATIRYCEKEEQMVAFERTKCGDANVTRTYSSPAAATVPASLAAAPVVPIMPSLAARSQMSDASMDDLTEKLSGLVLNRVMARMNTHMEPARAGRQSGSGVGLDPARSHSQAGHRSAYGGPPTCYFCGTVGHVSTKCFKKEEMLKVGIIHYDDKNILHLGKAREGGVRIPLSRDLPHLDSIQGMLSETEANRMKELNLRKLRMVWVDSDTEEEENEDLEPVGINAARAQKGKEPAPARQGAVLDGQRRVIKKRQEKENELPATKSMRSGTYRNALLQGVSDDEAAERQLAESTQETVQGGEDVGDATMTDMSARGKARRSVSFAEQHAATSAAAPGQKLTKALTQVKNAGAHKLADALLKQKVCVSVENLLSGSSDVRKLLFTSKDWDHDDGMIIARGLAAGRVGSLRVENEDDGDEPVDRALCPEVDVGIRGHDVCALLDTGAECNLMSTSLARVLKLPITSMAELKYQAVSFSGVPQRFVGIAKNVNVDLHGVRVKAHFFVTDKMDQEDHVILGAPYQVAARLGLWREADHSVLCRIHDPSSDVSVEFIIEQPDAEELTSLQPARNMTRINRVSVNEATG